MLMEYYPQPRPVMYGTAHEEAPPQTEIAPVRTGPPRYPPAPPLAGDAPFPYEPPREYLASMHEPAAVLLAILYALSSVYSLSQLISGALQHTVSGPAGIFATI